MTRLPVVRDVDPAAPIIADHVPIDPAGCPHCDEPEFPRRQCGKPACRDAQALAWARATGREPAAVLAALDHANASQGSVCEACARLTTCTVGGVVTGEGVAIGARLTQCRGLEPLES